MKAASRLTSVQAVLDGEVVVMLKDGRTDFQALQNAFRGDGGALQYQAFDLLFLNGSNVALQPLEKRKQSLAELLAGADVEPLINFSEHVQGDGPAFFEQAGKMGLEGIISKRRTEPYRTGRGDDWLKVKCMQKAEFVIGAYTEPNKSRIGFGALLLGYYDKDGHLLYAGKVGTGFDDRTLRSMLKELKGIEQDRSPFHDLKRAAGHARTAHWVSPTLIAQVAFGNWTREGHLRHPSFQGLRLDKSAAEVTREEAVPVKKAERQSNSKIPKADRKAVKAKTHKAKSPIHSREEFDESHQIFGGVRFTSHDKVLYPEGAITKLDLARYYQAIQKWILPHISDRPLVLVRCPEGQDKACFYQKHPGIGTPDSLRQISIREKNKTEPYVIVDDAAGLISLAQISALEIHAWGSRADKLESPDRLIFDLDPDTEVPWSQVVKAARQVRQFLADLGLESFVKTTGGKGLHLVVPIDRRHKWDEAKDFCKTVADSIVQASPRLYTANMSKAARPGKIFIDYLRNARGATAVLPYSTRARPFAPVSTPLTWDELSSRIRSDHYNVANLPARLSALKDDPWAGITTIRQGLSKPFQQLRKIQ